MPKIVKPNLSDYFNLPNSGLRSYLEHVRNGQPDEFRTTFAKGDSLSKVLEDWSPTLESIAKEWPTLVDFENDLKSKVGPMSIMKPLAERMSDIDSYFEDILRPSMPIAPGAIDDVVHEWIRLGGLRCRSQTKTVELMKKSTNSGSPYFTKRRNVVDKTIPCFSFHMGGYAISTPEGHVDGPGARMLLNTSEYARNGFPRNGKSYEACAVLGWRGQEGGLDPDDVKQRVVWMFPFAVNINELQLYQPLIEGAQKCGLVPAWISMDAVDQTITQMFDSKDPDDLVVCTDFSKFDQHFNEDLQLAAGMILRKLMHKGPAEQLWLQRVFPIKYQIPLLIQPDQMCIGYHGMGSGSGGTNADETLVHRALQYEAAHDNNATLNPNSQCLGDDGVLTYPGITVEDVVHSYTRHGLEMNVDKQYASKQDCIYLRRWHHKDYRINGVCAGVYSTYRALGRLCEQERYYDPDVWSKEMVALRQLSIIENVKYHPLRDQFAEFCMARDKYRLGLDIPGFLVSISRIAKEANELMPDFLGYTKSQQKDADAGIQSWWIVNYLKSK